jgi:NADH-quinone oxidoreductase subunit N
MDLTIQHFIALAPLLITSITIVVVMLGIAWRRNHSQSFLLTVAGLNLALLSIYPALKVAPLVVTPLLQIDSFACLYMGIILVSTLACVTLAHAYLGEGKAGYPGNREELYLLILMAAAGGLVLVAAQHLASLFIGLELLSVPVYGLVAYAFFNKRSLEGGIKYMVLSAAGSAFLLFGMALLYAESGSLGFSEIGKAIAATGMPSPIASLGLAVPLVDTGRVRRRPCPGSGFPRHGQQGRGVRRAGSPVPDLPGGHQWRADGRDVGHRRGVDPGR